MNKNLLTPCNTHTYTATSTHTYVLSPLNSKLQKKNAHISSQIKLAYTTVLDIMQICISPFLSCLTCWLCQSHGSCLLKIKTVNPSVSCTSTVWIKRRRGSSQLVVWQWCIYRNKRQLKWVHSFTYLQLFQNCMAIMGCTLNRSRSSSTSTSSGRYWSWRWWSRW